MPHSSIRAATPADIPHIRELAHRIWPETYVSVIGQQQVDYMLALMYSPEALERQMNEGARFLIAQSDQLPVGFASYQEMEPGVFKLHKLYVLPSEQGKGTGKMLVDHILSLIKPMGARTLQLQVNRNNRAQYFYQKLGFAISKEIKLDIGQGYFMDDYIMEKEV